MKTVADALGVARSNLVEQSKKRERRKRATPADDAWLLPRIRALTDERPSYGYRRVTALLNTALVAESQPRVNPKRIFLEASSRARQAAAGPARSLLGKPV